MNPIENLYQQVEEKINLFNGFAGTYQLNKRILVDHIGYACSSSERFHELRQLFEAHSEYIYQSMISARRIAVIKLINPIQTTCGMINFVELSDQKPDGSQIDCFNHMEFYPAEQTVETIVDYLSNQNVMVTKTVRPHHTTYDISLENNFKVRIEDCPLIEKIVREEIKLMQTK